MARSRCAWTVLAPDVSALADLQVLDRATAGGGCVGEEDLVAHAFVLVEQGRPGARMGTLAPHDDAGGPGIR
ncbi:hypothetical protein [Embleya sp. NBC_00888]|uniref:hypothetical protein n=1 Tax=Embleya sp. NBC_00888 TaxID=2975960 RepID=UPI00386E600C